MNNKTVSTIMLIISTIVTITVLYGLWSHSMFLSGPVLFAFLVISQIYYFYAWHKNQTTLAMGGIVFTMVALIVTYVMAYMA